VSAAAETGADAGAETGAETGADAAAAAGAADAVTGPEPAVAPAALPLAGPGAALNALAIDTTSDVLSLALLREGALAAQQYEAIGRRTTQEILPRIARLLEDAALTPRELDVLVVARGPGSFTGTRIGMAVAMTFAQVTGRPLVGVEALRLLAAQSEPVPGGAVPVLLNCARDEVYFARYRWQGGALARESGLALRRLESLLPELAGRPVVLRRFYPGVGTGAQVERAFAALPRLALRHAQPDAALLLAVGLGRYLAAPGRDWRRVEPIYLKSEAFRTWRPA
jgi:tRNA threonylcarbamoyl adenosine modification protein YeaZ